MKKQNNIPCQQKQCGYLKGGCKACQDCKAEPFLINEKCQTCFDCEYKAGFVRWQDGGEAKKQQEEFVKLLEEELKNKMEERKLEIKTEIKPIEKELK